MLKDWLKKKNISPDFAKQMGLHEKNGVLYFPVYNYKGEKLYTKYRDIKNNEPIKNPKGSKSTIYGANLLKDASKENTIVILEGESDVLSFNSHFLNNGFIGITSTTGVMSFKPEWVYKLYQLGFQEIIVMFDNDTAGHKGMHRLWLTANGYRSKLKFAFLTRHNDVSDAMSDKSDILDALFSAQTLSNGYMSHNGIEFSEDVKELEVAIKPKQYIDIDLQSRIEQAKQIPFGELINLDRQGKTLCPFHNDHKPSLTLWKEKNVMACFVCYKWWDTIAFTKDYHKVSFLKALDMLVPKEEKKVKGLITN